MKFTRTLLSSALLLASAQVFADTPTTPLVPYGSGVYFYAWNANEYCSTDKTINPTGICPEKWTDTVKNINAQVPAGADKAMIKYIYLDSITFNWDHNQPIPSTKTIFKVGGCGVQADISFCVSSPNGLTYANPQQLNGPAATTALAAELNNGLNSYYIMPMVSDAKDTALMTMSAGQLQSLAYSLACIANDNATPTSWAAGFTGGPTSCTDVFITPDDSLKSNSDTPIISGLAFDVENPDFSGRHYTGTFGDSNSAQDFYSALQADIGTSAGTKYIMFSRGPGGLLETNDGGQATAGLPTFGEILGGGTVNGTNYPGLNNNTTGLPKFIFSPQIYDLCDGLGNTTTSWACPIQAPFDFGYESHPSSALTLPAPYAQDNVGKPVWGAAYNNFQFFQPLPNSPMPGSTPSGEIGTTLNGSPVPLSWILFYPDGHDTDGNGDYNNPLDDLTIKAMSMPYLFKSELEGKSFAGNAEIKTMQYPHSSLTNTDPISPPNVPVQLTISGGASSQIWEHINLYNVDPGEITPNPVLPNSIAPASPYLTVDYYRYPTQFNPTYDVIPQANPANQELPFTPAMIYTNKQLCQYELPNGAAGGTIPHCISYKNPYGETVASYANAFFTTLQYALANDSNNGNTTAPFYGVAMYPFTPYGYFDVACTPSQNNPNPCHAGFFPEVPDGLVNGQKPETSFWKTYIGQFANQWTGSSTGTIPTAQDTSDTTPFAPAPQLMLVLPANYYTYSGQTTQVNFSVSQYPNDGNNSPTTAVSYRTNLVDATGKTVSSSSHPGGSCTPNGSNVSCIIGDAVPGNYTLQIQALDGNGGVITEVDAAALAAGSPPAPTPTSISITIQSGTITQIPNPPTNLFYTYEIKWTLNCPPGGSLPSHLASISTVNGMNGNTPFDESIIGGATPINPPATCGGTFTSTFTTRGANYSIAAGEDVSLFLIDNQYQKITPSVSTILSSPMSIQ